MARTGDDVTLARLAFLHGENMPRAVSSTCAQQKACAPASSQAAAQQIPSAVRIPLYRRPVHKPGITIDSGKALLHLRQRDTVMRNPLGSIVGAEVRPFVRYVSSDRALGIGEYRHGAGVHTAGIWSARMHCSTLRVPSTLI